MAHFADPEGFDMKKLLLALLAAVGVAAFFKRQRDAELDEAIWEEPRDL